MLRRVLAAVSFAGAVMALPGAAQQAASEPVADQAPSPSVPRLVLERYVGRYELNGTTVTVALTDDDRVTVQLAGQPVSLPLRTVSENEFAGDAAGVRLIFEGEGPKATRIRSRYAGNEVVGTRLSDTAVAPRSVIYSPRLTTIPDTPAGRQFAGWLKAFNSDDPDAFDAYMRQEFPTLSAPPGANRNIRNLVGGFESLGVESASESQIVVLLRERNWEDSYARLTLDVAPEPGGKITGARLQGVPPPPDATPTQRMSETQALAAIKAKLDAASAAGQFTGAVRVAHNGDTVFDYASGQADREHGVANTLDTLFRIGSMNKMITAVSILQLVEAGKINLDAPIATYLPDYSNKDLASRVTVRHLLTHTGGTGDFFGPEFNQHRLELCEHSDYLKLFGARDVLFTPGERFAYSNYGFLLLGGIIEAVTGQSYYDYVQEHVYAPAGMRSTASLPEAVEVPGRSVGYTAQIPGSNGVLQPNTDTLPCRGTSAGGGYSTVGDLIRFSEALRTGKLISPQLFEEATKAQMAMGPGAGYGFGFAANDVNGTPAFGHSGGAPGMSADLTVFPELGYEVAVAANMDSQLVPRLAAYLGARLPVPHNGS
ncbi:MAG: serine hydrolase [Porphyrobacter sp.]|nr:serine hydrolase [Porphyrobacter sp.]